MGLLARIFGLKENNDASTETLEQEAPLVDQDLFMTQEEPEASAGLSSTTFPEAQTTAKRSQEGILTEILQRPHYDRGLEQGYYTGKPHLEEQYKESLIAEAVYLLEQEQFELESQVLEREQLKRSFESSEKYELLSLVQKEYELLKKHAQRLEREISLAEKGKGILLKALNDYSRGFFEGFKRRIEEESISNTKNQLS